MKFNTFTILIFLLLTSCSVTRDWESTQTDTSLKARYSNFNGKEKIVIERNPEKIAYISYLSNTKAGKLNIDLNRENQPFSKGKVMHQKYLLEKPLKIRIKGEHANGAFYLNYPTFEKKDLKVHYNKNFELLALSYFLLETYEDVESNKNTFDYNGKEVTVEELYSLNLKIGEEFKKFNQSKNLEKIHKYLETNWYLEYANFVMNLENFPNAKIPDNIEKYKHLFNSDGTEEWFDNATLFINLFNELYKEIEFDRFLTNYKPYYNNMVAEVKCNLPDKSFILEMEHLYNKELDNYFLNPSLTMPFSQGFALGGENKSGYVFGALTLPLSIDNPENLSLGYDNSKEIRNLSVHEFGHLFVNPAVDKVNEKIIINNEELFKPIEKEMADQAYSSWKISLYEHFVRAGEIFIAKLLKDHQTAENLFKDYVQNRNFIYLDQIITAMEKWYNYDYSEKTYEQFVKETILNLKEVA